MKQGLYLAIVVAMGAAACVPAKEDPQPIGAPSPAQQSAPAQAAAPPTAMPELSHFAIEGQARQGGVLRGVLPPGVLTLSANGKPLAVAEDRRWILAFDRDAPAKVVLAAEMADGRDRSFDLAVSQGDWRIERVNVPLRGSATTSAEFQRRRAAELAQIADARSVSVQSDGWRQKFIWPVSGRFSGFFGSQRIYQGVAGSYHSGTDIAVPRGTPFVAPADGVVVLAASQAFTLEGNLLIISHGMGLNSAFLHCDRLDVKAGDVVRQGQVLGTVGSTGRSTGPHMHWGMKWRDARVDPGSFI